MVSVREISATEACQLLARHESHFFDFKAKEIQPAKLTVTLCAFANADSGEVCVGVKDPAAGEAVWEGFAKPEDANQHIAVLEALFPEGDVFSYSFLECSGQNGLVLLCEIQKNQNVWKDSQGQVYIRKGAQNIKQGTFEQQERHRLNKGMTSYEDHKTNLSLDDLLSSAPLIEFAREIVPRAEPAEWLRKQKVIKDDFATVAGALLYSD